MDGSKKKLKSTDDYETFEGNFIWELMKGSGGVSMGLDFCSYCEVEVPIHPKKLFEHYNCSRHRNNQTIHNLLPLFAQHGVTYIDGEKNFYCEEYDCVLESKVKTLIEHIKDHSTITKTITEGGDEHFEDHVFKIFRHKLWMTDLKSSQSGLNIQLLSYRRIHSPMTLREDSPSNAFIANFSNDIFSKEELAFIVKAASYLKTKGENVNRSENIQGSKMCVYGMRWTYGDTGWYSHKHKDVYKVALELAEFISNKLEVRYPIVFEHLRKILQIEGFNDGEASLCKSPFTTFAVTRNYYCRPHLDGDDYDL